MHTYSDNYAKLLLLKEDEKAVRGRSAFSRLSNIHDSEVASTINASVVSRLANFGALVGTRGSGHKADSRPEEPVDSGIRGGSGGSGGSGSSIGRLLMLPKLATNGVQNTINNRPFDTANASRKVGPLQSAASRLLQLKKKHRTDQGGSGVFMSKKRHPLPESTKNSANESASPNPQSGDIFR